jgi:hypothetical protein
MRAALAAWRVDNGAQENRPNPACVEEAFRELYLTTDASRFDPLTASSAVWEQMQHWRSAMNRAAPWKD